MSDRERLLPLDARRVPAARPRGGRVGGSLPRDDRGPPGAEPGRARVGARRSCRRRRPTQPRRSTPSSPTSTGWSSRASPTGSTRAGTPTSRRARPGPSVLADLVSSASACRGCSGRPRRPAPSSRRIVLDWMAELLGLPERFRSDGAGGGVIEESASGATLCALLAARWRAAGDGPFDHLRAYTSTQAHSSVEKAVRIAGLRPEQLRHDRGRRRLRAAAGRAGAPRWPRTAPPASRRSSSSPPSAPPPRPRSIRSPPIADACARARRLAARRRRPRRLGAGVPRAALDRRRGRAGRQLLHEPAQVAVHQLRLRLLLGRRPRAR